VRKLRERPALRDSSGNRQYADGPTLASAIELIRRLLNSRLEDTEELNYEAAAYGALALAILFRVRDKAEVLDLLERVYRKSLAILTYTACSISSALAQS
jgi:hypothetical protein